MFIIQAQPLIFLGYRPGSKTMEIMYGIEAQLLKTLQLKWNFTYDIIDTNNSWIYQMDYLQMVVLLI